MRLEFEATVEDYLAMQEDWLRRSSPHYRQPTPPSTWVILFASFALGGAFAAGMAAEFEPDTLVQGGVLGMMAGGTTWVLLATMIEHHPWFRARAMSRYMAMIRRNIESGDYPADLGPHALVVEDDALVFECPTRTLRYAVGNLDGMEDHPDCLYFTLRGQVSLRLPKRAFAADAQQAEFRRLVEPWVGGGAGARGR